MKRKILMLVALLFTSIFCLNGCKEDNKKPIYDTIYGKTYYFNEKVICTDLDMEHKINNTIEVNDSFLNTHFNDYFDWDNSGFYTFTDEKIKTLEGTTLTFATLNDAINNLAKESFKKVYNGNSFQIVVSSKNEKKLVYKGQEYSFTIDNDTSLTINDENVSGSFTSSTKDDGSINDESTSFSLYETTIVQEVPTQRNLFDQQIIFKLLLTEKARQELEVGDEFINLRTYKMVLEINKNN